MLLRVIPRSSKYNSPVLDAMAAARIRQIRIAVHRQMHEFSQSRPGSAHHARNRLLVRTAFDELMKAFVERVTVTPGPSVLQSLPARLIALIRLLRDVKDVDLGTFMTRVGAFKRQLRLPPLFAEVLQAYHGDIRQYGNYRARVMALGRLCRCRPQPFRTTATPRPDFLPDIDPDIPIRTFEPAEVILPGATQATSTLTYDRSGGVSPEPQQ